MKFSELPPELESEILSRVPATSLMQLKTSCKRWYVLFKDLRFVEKNLAKGKAARQVMLKQYGSDFSVSINMHGFHSSMDPYIKFTSKLKRLSLKNSEHGFDEAHSNYKQLVIIEIFHCNGLLLCTTNHNRFAVWNPCTCQIRWIHAKPSCYPMHKKYFLGYENKNNSCHSYKILTFNNYYNGRVPEFDIYELNTDSWRVLGDVTHDWRIESNGVTWKGNAYCFATYIKEPFLTFMLKFDFTTERFERLSLPFHSEYEDDFVFLSVIVGEEKLALLHFDEVSFSVMKIWVTNGKSDEVKDLPWINFLEVDLNQFGTFIGGMTRDLSFLVDEENKLVVYCDTDEYDKNRTEIYIFGENIYKQVYRGTEEGSEDHHPLLISYVPSLVQIPG